MKKMGVDVSRTRTEVMGASSRLGLYQASREDGQVCGIKPPRDVGMYAYPMSAGKNYRRASFVFARKCKKVLFLSSSLIQTIRREARGATSGKPYS